MRIFLAILLTEPVQRHSQEVQQKLAPMPGVKWTSAENLHVTLKFLGEVDDPAIAPLCAALTAAPLGGPFELRPEAIEDWGGVIVSSMTGDREAAAKLASVLDDTCAELGFVRENRPYQPHITLGRRRGPSRKGRRIEIATDSVPTLKVDSICLMQSILGQGSPKYTPLATIPLPKQ